MTKQSPAKQGDFDGACGFYAVGNALSLLHPGTPIDKIFYAIFEHYIKNHNDAATFVNGMYRTKLNEILMGAIDSLQFDCAVYRPFWNNPAKTFKLFHETLLANALGDNCVAIVGYDYSKGDDSDWYSHWTVLKKATTKTLITHDSDNELKRIAVSKCRIWDNKARNKTKPYKIASTDLFLLSKHSQT
jgi:hypothetical protein